MGYQTVRGHWRWRVSGQVPVDDSDESDSDDSEDEDVPGPSTATGVDISGDDDQTADRDDSGTQPGAGTATDVPTGVSAQPAPERSDFGPSTSSDGIHGDRMTRFEERMTSFEGRLTCIETEMMETRREIVGLRGETRESFWHMGRTLTLISDTLMRFERGDRPPRPPSPPDDDDDHGAPSTGQAATDIAGGDQIGTTSHRQDSGAGTSSQHGHSSQSSLPTGRQSTSIPVDVPILDPTPTRPSPTVHSIPISTIFSHITSDLSHTNTSPITTSDTMTDLHVDTHDTLIPDIDTFDLDTHIPDIITSHTSDIDISIPDISVSHDDTHTPLPDIPDVDTPTFGTDTVLDTQTPTLSTASLSRELGFHTPGFQSIISDIIFDPTPLHSHSCDTPDPTLVKPSSTKRKRVTSKGRSRGRATRTHFHDLRPIWPKTSSSRDTPELVDLGSSSDDEESPAF